jgi:hypothetical protein
MTPPSLSRSCITRMCSAHPGVGFENTVDFFRLYSHGNLDLSGSQVFGWFVLPHARAEYTGSGVNPAGRQQLIDWAKTAATDAGVDLTQFFNVVVCMNVSTDLFGGISGAVCDNYSTQPSPLGQEMLHGYGVNHARINGSTVDYTDPFDVMSVYSAQMSTDTDYFGTRVSLGPGLTFRLPTSSGPNGMCVIVTLPFCSP